MTILDGYLDAAAWANGLEDGEDFDAGDLSAEFIEQARRDCEDFEAFNASDLQESGLSRAQIGHDFWLTRNGHGAGFWDRGLGEVGERLTEAAKFYGSVDLYLGEDGLLYA